MSSASATILQARIDELSLAIEEQKQILGDLEKRRSDARRDLNATLDPMARLPVEISSDIFALCLPESPRPHSDEAPMLFLNICRLWRDIATSTPSLWSSISCESTVANALNLDIWLRRARSLPLHISLCGDLRPGTAFSVKKHAPQLRVLKLEFQHLKEIASPFPALAELTVIRTTINNPTHRQCIDILRSAPALEECEFICTSWQDAVEAEDPYPPIPFTHPSLQSLALRAECSSKSTNAASMLECLTLPALVVLVVSDVDITTAKFAAFLTRSAPPLRFFHVVDLEDNNFLGSLRPVPSLTDLSLCFADSEIDPFFVLRDLTSDQNFLPNLCSLDI